MEYPKKFFTPRVANYIIKNSTVFLAMLSAYMYICAYSYEQAYLKEFGVSSAYLNLDINTILRDATRLIGIVVILTGSYHVLLRMLHSLLIKSRKHREAIQTIVALFIGLLLAWIYFPINNHLFVYILSIVGVVYLLICLSVFLKNIITKTGNKKSDSAFSDSKQIYYGFNKYYIYIFLFIINPIFICQLLGQGEAYKQHNFEMIHDTINHIIIRKYGDEMICKDLTKKNQVENNTTLIYLNHDKEIKITNIETGYVSTSNNLETNFVLYLRKQLNFLL